MNTAALTVYPDPVSLSPEAIIAPVVATEKVFRLSPDKKHLKEFSFFRNYFLLGIKADSWFEPVGLFDVRIFKLEIRLLGCIRFRVTKVKII